MPPPRRRPATPPARRPKVAGLHRRTDQAEDEVPEVAPELDVPVIGEDKPRPAAKHRDSGTLVPPVAEPSAEEAVVTPPRRRRRQDPVPQPPAVKPAAESAAEKEPGTDPEEAVEDTAAEPHKPEVIIAVVGEEPERRLEFLLPTVLLVVALLLGGLGFFFAQKVSDARAGAGNDVLSDVNATKDVVGAANTAVTAVLSYKFDDMAGATKRAKEYLVGEAVDQYDKSMKALEAEIQNQKLQVVVNPVSVGVVRLAGDEARVLVFADQIGTRADKQPSGGPTQFALDMRRVDGTWKIVKLDFFETR